MRFDDLPLAGPNFWTYSIAQPFSVVVAVECSACFISVINPEYKFTGLLG